MEKNKVALNDSKVAALGSVNGILFYDVIWPYFAVLIMKLLFLSNYQHLVNTKYYFMSLILMVITSILTFVSAIIIAKPKNLIKAYGENSLSWNMVAACLGFNVYAHDKKKLFWKLVFACLGSMMLFSFMYNLLLVTIGLDIGGGNANQTNVVLLIKENALLAFIAMVVLAPVLEEITYRYFLFGGIAKFNRKWAIVISGFIFMCVHGVASFTQEVDNIFVELLLLPPYMFSGMVLAYAYDKSENLAVSTSIHVLNNLISFVLCLL